MRKIITSILAASLLLLTGCENGLSEEDLVGNGQAFEMQKISDDLQASNFPFQDQISGEDRVFYTLPELKEEVKELLGDRYWPEVSLTQEEMEEDVGITEDMYVEYLAEKQVLDSHIDTMIIVHAKEECIGAVEQALEAYRAKIIEQNENYPQNLAKAEASRMETIEDYICFIQLGADTTAVADQGVDAVIDYCLEENERALYVLEQAILEQ